MRKALKFLGNVAAVLGLLAVGVIGMGGMIVTRERPVSSPPEVLPPIVETAVVEKGPVRLTVRTQGTVAPRTEVLLVSEVAGKLIETAPSFVTGGFFEKGEVLLRIDPRDFELAVTQARARVAQAEARRVRVEAEAALAAEEWKALGEGEAPPLALHRPQVAQARADLEAAEASLAQARLRLERTVLKAPFAGCLRERMADVGQVVSPSAPLARIFAVDFAEVRLPLSDGQRARLELPLPRGGEEGRVPVLLRARVAGALRTWEGRIVRMEGHLDPQSRMVYAVARVEDPYGAEGKPEVPLSVGLFVEAEIQGRRVGEAVVLPRTAVREGGRVLVVDGENRLRFRPVELVESRGDEVVVGGGLEDGETVCLSRLDAVTEGTRIRTAGSRVALASPARESEVAK